MTNKNANQRNKSDLQVALKEMKHIFIMLGIYSFFLNILMLAAPFYMLVVYDIVMPSKNLNTLLLVTLITIMFFIGMWILDYVRSKLTIYASNKLDLLLNERIFNATFALASKFPDKANTQPLQDFKSIKTFLSGQGIFAFFDFPWFPIYIAIMFAFSPVYGIYGLVATAIILVLTWLNEKMTKEGLEESNKSYAHAMNFFGNNIRNVEVVQAMGMRENLHRLWMEKYNSYLMTNNKASTTGSFYSNASKSFRMLSSSMMYGVGAILVIGGSISPGMIIAGAVLMGRALQPVSQIIGGWKQFSGARIAYHKLNSLLQDFPKEEKKLSLPEPEGKITFDQVVTIPPLGKIPVLKGINLQINTGETIGVIGPSAAGKSSFVKTAVGVWEPSNGHIRIDGADIHQYNRIELGKHIGYLPQDIELFGGTVAQNISRFEEDPSDEDIIEAAKLSGTHELILNLPDGYSTRVGVGGMALSGGQKQRIGLARALYGNPKIVVLDEPNSNLDDAGEYALTMALRVMKEKGITVIFVTHKQNILSLADKLLVLNDGKTVYYDEREKVMNALYKNSTQVINDKTQENKDKEIKNEDS
ncbi:type I secretion system permease/ATPase [Sulfurovum sp. NBC37-1]|uniref:type I secretion system permease/ATPase n=1 Tax=Sulfurovum sp. (strain NBC37-1) TaxID=387093 RepID=UPI0001587748|nr:type I secretion system permease/ATPase [Sulfurovum sp. NBC37-1]BAF71301.1 type I secretion system ATPase [Sulfurovum sp. NBC37-1]